MSRNNRNNYSTVSGKTFKSQFGDSYRKFSSGDMRAGEEVQKYEDVRRENFAQNQPQNIMLNSNNPPMGNPSMGNPSMNNSSNQRPIAKMPIEELPMPQDISQPVQQQKMPQQPYYNYDESRHPYISSSGGDNNSMMRPTMNKNSGMY